MPTPSIQTLTTDAQQVLNLDSISAVRSVVAVALANANTGTPLNPNLTTQQLWNEFYQVVTKPKSDIESIIANQLMKFLYAPPAPGGVGADKQVIFNDGGVLAGDPQFLWDKTTNLLTVTGSATITGDLTVATSALKVDSVNSRVGVGTATPAAGAKLGVLGATTVSASDYIGSSTWAARFIGSSNGAASGISFLTNSASGLPTPASLHALPVADYRSALVATYSADPSGAGYFAVNRFNPTLASTFEHYKIDNAGVATWSNVGGVAGTAMTLNSTGLGVGVSPAANSSLTVYRANSNSALRVTNGPSANNVGITLESLGGNVVLNNGNGPLEVSVGGSLRATIDTSGNLLVGTTAAAGSASNSTKTVGGLFSTVNGSTASTASGAAVTMFTSPTEATFMVSAYIFGTGAPASYNAIAIVKVSGSTAAITTVSSATGLTISLSGLNVQVTQTSGSPQVIVYSAIRIS